MGPVLGPASVEHNVWCVEAENFNKTQETLAHHEALLQQVRDSFEEQQMQREHSQVALWQSLANKTQETLTHHEALLQQARDTFEEQQMQREHSQVALWQSLASRDSGIHEWGLLMSCRIGTVKMKSPC